MAALDRLEERKRERLCFSRTILSGSPEHSTDYNDRMADYNT